jgi:hypothetical protein
MAYGQTGTGKTYTMGRVFHLQFLTKWPSSMIGCFRPNGCSSIGRFRLETLPMGLLAPPEYDHVGDMDGLERLIDGRVVCSFEGRPLVSHAS